MYRLTLFLASALLLACGETAPASPVDKGGGGAGGSTGTTSDGGTTTSSSSGTDPLEFPTDDDFAEDATVDDTLDATISAPTQLTDQAGALVAMTADDRIVYSTSEGVLSLKAASGALPRKASSSTGLTHVVGNTIFTFADIDYGLDLGYLTFWTPAAGRRTVGIAALGADEVAARHDDAYVLFARNLLPDTMDIVVCSADKERAQVLVSGVGRGDLETCGPNFGFAGDTAIVAWCAVGSVEATLARFTLNGQGTWEREDISTSAQGQWASDPTGERLFYVTNTGNAFVSEPEGERWLSSGVNWGAFDPTGDVVFFTVGDQLRRQDGPGSPIPIVVQSFDQDVAWNDDMSVVVYSSEILYEVKETRDLHATSTDWFNPTPTVLVDGPTAELGRSILTGDGEHVIYFTHVVAGEGGRLHVVPIGGGPEVTREGVDGVLAADGDTILFTDNRTPPDVYPVLVDLKKLEAGGNGGAYLLESGIVDGRDIQVRSDRVTVAYRRTDEAGGSIWVRPIQAQQ